MRPFSVISATLLLACVAATGGRADTAAQPAEGTVAAPAAACDEWGPNPPRTVRRHRHVRVTVHRHRRHWRAAPVVLVPPPYPLAVRHYDAPIPSPWDSAYDRAMVLHFRSPTVAGIYIPEPGYPPTPPIRAVQPYRFPANGTVYQYDGLTGEYIPLSRPDAARVMAALEPVAPPPPPR